MLARLVHVRERSAMASIVAVDAGDAVGGAVLARNGQVESPSAIVIAPFHVGEGDSGESLLEVIGKRSHRVVLEEHDPPDVCCGPCRS